MFKLKTKRTYLHMGLILIIGIIFVVLGVYAANSTIGNALDLLNKKVQKTAEIDKIFDGKANIENIYDLALGVAKGNKTKTITTSLDQINLLLPEDSDQKTNKKDLLNILYDTDNGVRNTIKSINGKISSKDIEASYLNLAKSLACAKKNETIHNEGKISLDDRNCVKSRVSNNFTILSQNNYNIHTFNQDNYGEELFMNSSLDDSEYDIMIDIDRIGSLLFDSFKAPTETLFYKYPKINSNKNGSQNTSSSTSTVADLLAQIANGNGGSTTNETIVGSTGSSQQTNIPTTTPTTTTTNTNQNNNNNTDLPSDIENFIQDTNITTTNTTTTTTEGNSCVPGIASDLTQTTTETVPTEKQIEEYLTKLDTAIKQYEAKPELGQTPEVLINNTTTSGTTGSNQLVEDIIGDLFDTGAVQACIQKCNGLSASDQIICKIECLCKKVSLPKFKDPKLTSMNDSLILRFCTVPVEKNRISKAASIYSRDEMLTRIQGLFDNLINGGEMVKYYRTKEYLENPIAGLKWHKMLSFNITTTVKPLFNNKTTKAKQTQETNKTKKMQSTVGGKNENPGVDVNKYIVVSNYIKDRVNKIYGNSVEDYNKKYEEEKAEAKNIIANQKDIKEISTHLNEKSAIINEGIITFLNNNGVFWQNMIDQLNQFNQDAYTLKNSSKFTE